MTKWRTAIFAAMLLSGCSRPEQGATPAGSPAAAPPSGETLLADVPPGWVQGFGTVTPGIRMVEYVPPGTDAADWADKLSFESFSGEPLPDPVELVTSIANDQRKICDGFESHATYSGTENGYPTAVRLFVCKRNSLTQKGQLTLLKMIRGDENFYVITRARRVDPILDDDTLPMLQQVMAEWSLYLRAIGVCNADDPAHPCPAAPQAGVEPPSE